MNFVLSTRVIYIEYSFCFDEGRIVILFNGFQKENRKDPKEKKIEKSKDIKKGVLWKQKQMRNSLTSAH